MSTNKKTLSHGKPPQLPQPKTTKRLQDTEVDRKPDYRILPFSFTEPFIRYPRKRANKVDNQDAGSQLEFTLIHRREPKGTKMDMIGTKSLSTWKKSSGRGKSWSASKRVKITRDKLEQLVQPNISPVSFGWRFSMTTVPYSLVRSTGVRVNKPPKATKHALRSRNFTVLEEDLISHWSIRRNQLSRNHQLPLLSDTNTPVPRRFLRLTIGGGAVHWSTETYLQKVKHAVSDSCATSVQIDQLERSNDFHAYKLRCGRSISVDKESSGREEGFHVLSTEQKFPPLPGSSGRHSLGPIVDSGNYQNHANTSTRTYAKVVQQGPDPEDEIKRIAKAFFDRGAQKKLYWDVEPDSLELLEIQNNGMLKVKVSSKYYTWPHVKINGILCLSCQALRHDGLSLTDHRVWDWDQNKPTLKLYHLGLLKDIFSRHYCALCRTICKALPSTAWGSWLLPLGGATRLALRQMGSDYEIVEVSLQDPQRRMPNFRSGLGEIYTGSRARTRNGVTTARWDSPRRHSRQLLATTPWFRNETFERKISDLQEQFTHLKHALYVCKTSHRSCGQLVSREKTVPGLLLIDVTQRCIVSAKPGTKYIALSYVWGSVKMLQTTSSELAGLKKPGSLIHNDKKIPQTILDAMDAVEALEESYLWVDSLCIVQDDASVKHDQISKMHIIYGQATLTLIAMSGEHANAGLFEKKKRRYSSFRDFDCEEIVHGGEVAARASWLSPLFFKSHYSKRGWTFQERILSARCLYFTKDTIYFQCPQTLSTNEGVLLQGVKLSKDLGSLNPLLTDYKKPDQVGTKGQKKAKNQQQMMPFTDQRLLVYEHLVNDYTTKELSYDSDILNAFEGVLQNVFEGISSVLIGLPERYFDAALLWVSLGQAARRKGTTEMTEASTSDSIHLYPSWAWTGWKGSPAIYAIDVFGEGLPWNGGQLNSCIEQFHVLTPGARGRRLLETQRDTAVHRRLSARYPTSAMDEEVDEMSTDTLLFAADVVSFKDLRIGAVRRFTSENLKTLDLTAILDAKGNRCGSLISFFPLIDVAGVQNDSHILEWILLSLNQNILFHAPWQNLSDEVYNSKFFERRKWCTANIMLIHWKGKIAERVGLGIIHIDAWEELCTRSKMIKLQ